MKIELRDLKSSDREYFYTWIKDGEVIRYSLSVFQKMKSNDDISKWFDGVLVDKS